MPRRPQTGGSSAGYLCNDEEADARHRIGSGCGLYVNKGKLPAGMNPGYARLVLLRALGLFHELTGLDQRQFMGRLTWREKKLLMPVLNVEEVLRSLSPLKNK